MAVASPPWAGLPRPIGPTRLETMTSRRGGAPIETRALREADVRDSHSPTVESASFIDILSPRRRPKVETVPRQRCSASHVGLGPRSGKPIERRPDRLQIIKSSAVARWRAHPDRDPAAAIDLGERRFVGRIVAGEYRQSTAKRRLGLKG